jgi:hypothetical protein
MKVTRIKEIFLTQVQERRGKPCGRGDIIINNQMNAMGLGDGEKRQGHPANRGMGLTFHP